MDSPGSSVHGIFQARILECVAISFSRRSSRPRDRTQVPHIAGRAYNLSRQGRSLDNYKQVIWALWEWSFICVCSMKEKSKLISPCLDTKVLQFNLLKRLSFPNTLEWHHGHKSGNQTSRSISGSLISPIYFLYPCANTTILVTVVLISLISNKFIKFYICSWRLSWLILALFFYLH